MMGRLKELPENLGLGGGKGVFAEVKRVGGAKGLRGQSLEADQGSSWNPEIEPRVLLLLLLLFVVLLACSTHLSIKTFLSLMSMLIPFK